MGYDAGKPTTNDLIENINTYNSIKAGFQTQTSMALAGVDHSILHGGGIWAEKEITLDASATTASVNIFQITGSVKLFEIYGVITDATTLANLTVGFLEMDDGAAQVGLTLNDGVLSAMPVGTVISKTDLASVTMTVSDPSTTTMTESTRETLFAEALLTQKSATASYLRFTYTTSDAPIAATIFWHARYVGIDNGTTIGTLVAV